jgi:hypothetical protein
VIVIFVARADDDAHSRLSYSPANRFGFDEGTFGEPEYVCGQFQRLHSGTEITIEAE